jgi:hypothetical protein
MASLLECNARAALCRRRAKLEPVSRDIWLAEAERWSRLAHARLLAQKLAMAGIWKQHWQAKSTFMKKETSLSEKPGFGTKNRRCSDWTLVRSTAASMSSWSP